MWTKPAALAGKGLGDRTTLSRTIADHIGSMIRQGDLKPGEQLPSQRDLALRFGVSRPSLREAFSVLETMGLVTVRVGSGIYVAPAEARAPLWRFSDRASPRDVYEARVGLEGYAARLAASRVDAAAVVSLEDAVAAMAEALAAEDIPGMAAADARFHDLIFEIGANPVLAGMYQPMRDMMVESQRLPMTLKKRLGDTLDEHRTLCARLAARDPGGAEAAMQNHIRAAARRYGIAIG